MLVFKHPFYSLFCCFSVLCFFVYRLKLQTIWCSLLSKVFIFFVWTRYNLLSSCKEYWLSRAQKKSCSCYQMKQWEGLITSSPKEDIKQGDTSGKPQRELPSLFYSFSSSFFFNSDCHKLMNQEEVNDFQLFLSQKKNFCQISILALKVKQQKYHPHDQTPVWGSTMDWLQKSEWNSSWNFQHNEACLMLIPKVIVLPWSHQSLWPSVGPNSSQAPS